MHGLPESRRGQRSLHSGVQLRIVVSTDEKLLQNHWGIANGRGRVRPLR
ncbi:hypothetical protein RISK_002732 [Rhodopirellula islandica]|uniref:Uncharacterized protein n=1 Tax=Rhodopirellula islandica TaxID=595434 RepID=A0A0J1BFF8_RHOIS|nr:hypothetical protein RISK_002732 [Rhodopirellula islandica]